MVFITVYDDDDLDDANCDLGLAEGEVLDVMCYGLLFVSILVPVLVVDGLVADGLIFPVLQRLLEHWSLAWQKLPLGQSQMELGQCLLRGWP